MKNRYAQMAFENQQFILMQEKQQEKERLLAQVIEVPQKTRRSRFFRSYYRGTSLSQLANYNCRKLQQKGYLPKQY